MNNLNQTYLADLISLAETQQQLIELLRQASAHQEHVLTEYENLLEFHMPHFRELQTEVARWQEANPTLAPDGEEYHQHYSDYLKSLETKI